MRYIEYLNLEHNGRLGNQLYQIAWILGHGITAGRIPKIKPDWSYRSYFNIPDIYYGSLPHDTSQNDILDGGTKYYQDMRYFDHMLSDIRKYFGPSPVSTIQLDKTYPEFKRNIYKVSIHVRRGDYLKYPNHFPICSSSYFGQALEIVRSKNANPMFCIFSDDISWCRSNLPYLHLDPTDDILFMDRTNITPVEVSDRTISTDYIDLFAQRACDAHVISNSSFSLWGALLANRKDKPIAPANWFGPALTSDPGQEDYIRNSKLMYPKDWITI